MDGDLLRSQRAFYRTALDQHALSFWYAHGYDAERGGFFAPVYADGHQQNQKRVGTRGVACGSSRVTTASTIGNRATSQRSPARAISFSATALMPKATA